MLEKKEDGVSKIYYYTDYTNLEINGRSAFATFAKPDEMVVLLRNSQPAWLLCFLLFKHGNYDMKEINMIYLHKCIKD